MTLRLTDDEQEQLRRQAKDEGVSMQEVARRAIHEYTTRGRHRDRVSGAARRVIDAHGDALDRLGQ